MKSKEELRKVFENGDKPNQEDFKDWQDSYWHKEDPLDIIPAERVDLSQKADLVNGKIPPEQLPSYVDDIIEIESFENFPTAGESGKLYLDLLTNKLYRWSGSVYVDISPSQASASNLQEVTNNGNSTNKELILNGAPLGYNITTSSIRFGGTPENISSGKYNSSFGNSSLNSNTTGTRNTSVGAFSLYTNQSSADNTAIGYSAGQNLKAGDFLTAVGSQAAYAMVNSNNATAIGTWALKSVTASVRDTAIGALAMQNLQSGNYTSLDGVTSRTVGFNVAVGQGAMNTLSRGYANTFVGSNCGANFRNQGDFNTFLGAFIAGYTTNTWGDNNIIIGAYAPTNAGISNKLIIHSQKTPSWTTTPLIYGDFIDRWVTIGGKISATSVTTTPNSEFPTTPTAGQITFKTPENKHFGYDGTSWNPLY